MYGILASSSGGEGVGCYPTWQIRHSHKRLTYICPLWVHVQPSTIDSLFRLTDVSKVREKLVLEGSKRERGRIIWYGLTSGRAKKGVMWHPKGSIYSCRGIYRFGLAVPVGGNGFWHRVCGCCSPPLDAYVPGIQAVGARVHHIGMRTCLQEEFQFSPYRLGAMIVVCSLLRSGVIGKGI